jgi:hypothetical protein
MGFNWEFKALKCNKCCRAGQATDGNIIRRMRVECRITNAADTLTESAIIIVLFPATKVIRTRLIVT